MRTIALLLLSTAFLACAAAPEPVPAETEFSRELVERTAAAPAPARVSASRSVAVPPAEPPEAVLAGLVLLTPAETAALDPAGLLTRDEIVALAVENSPAVRSARAKLSAARTGYRQAADLEDLVAAYRSFARETETRVGPDRIRRGTGAIAPAPNLAALSGQITAETVAMAREHLRGVIISVVTAAEKVYADAARLAVARQIVAEDVQLVTSLVAVVRARFSAGSGSQSGLLAFEARLAGLRTDLAVFADEEASLRADLNRLLSRPVDAPLTLPTQFADPGEPAGAADLEVLALTRNPVLLAAGYAVARARVAVRMAETMVYPRMDLGSSRYERERAVEAGPDRGMVFPEPGRMIMPRAQFGVREAQVTEMREREAALVAAEQAGRDRVGADVHRAVAAFDTARRRVTVHAEELVPLATRALASARGAYEGSGAGYLDLLDTSRRLLAARLGAADANRKLAYARAGLISAVGVVPGEE